MYFNVFILDYKVTFLFFCLNQELQTAAVYRIWCTSKILSVRPTFLEILLEYRVYKYPVYTFCISCSSIKSYPAVILQTNATRWLRKEAGRRRLVLQRRAAGRELQLRQQLQEEVCLPVTPADLHLHPIHQPKHLTVRLQVCACAHFHPHHLHPQPQSRAAQWWPVQGSVAYFKLSEKFLNAHGSVLNVQVFIQCWSISVL